MKSPPCSSRPTEFTRGQGRFFFFLNRRGEENFKKKKLKSQRVQTAVLSRAEKQNLTVGHRQRQAGRPPPEFKAPAAQPACQSGQVS